MADTLEKRSLFQRIGPGLITAAVVLGPGSIVASSSAGAKSGYDLIWVMVAACVFMMAFTAMGARLGCALPGSPLQYVADRWGRVSAAIVGLSAFLVASGFQFGNNIGVSVAIAEITPIPAWILPIIFTVLSLVFLLTAKETYKLLERAMLVLVGVMLVAFLGNLLLAGFSPTKLAGGLVPSVPEEGEVTLARAMFATTFSVVAAFYQAYLVQAKGWKRENVRTAIHDTWFGIGLLCGLSLIILMGAAETLYGTGRNFSGVGELAGQLRQVLGEGGIYIFCAGLAAASFSSFIVNALIGGSLLVDGLGYSTEPNGKPVRIATAVAMIMGCVVAVAVFLRGAGSTQSLIIAQSGTLVAVPLCALLLFGLSSSRTIMGDLKNRWPVMIIGTIGTAILIFFSYQTLMKLVGRLLS